jgi:hypothetical protein
MRAAQMPVPSRSLTNPVTSEHVRMYCNDPNCAQLVQAKAREGGHSPKGAPREVTYDIDLGGQY